MNKLKRQFSSIFMATIIVIGFTTTAFANGQSLDKDSVEHSGTRIDYSELPEAYREIASPSSIIYQQEDGSYDIYKNDPVVNMGIVPLAMDRYAPKGGSYSNLEKGKITNLTYVVYQTYLPRDEVDKWITDQVPGMRNYIVTSIAELGISKASTVATKVLKKYGMNLSVTAIVAIAQGSYFTLKWLNFQQVKKASNSGKNGILIEYLTTIGSGNARVYTFWIGSYVPMYPRGGTAKWHEGNYYVMP